MLLDVELGSVHLRLCILFAMKKPTRWLLSPVEGSGMPAFSVSICCELQVSRVDVGRDDES
jgi:hypothetical protein